MGRFQSGQMGQTVNLLAHAFVGSNPTRPTASLRVTELRSAGTCLHCMLRFVSNLERGSVLRSSTERSRAGLRYALRLHYQKQDR